MGDFMSPLERRRSERILAPIRIRVSGNDASGVLFTEETVTVSFNEQGARITLLHSLRPGHTVLIKNLENGVEEEFRVMGAYQQVLGNRCEWGVEAMNPGSDVWGEGLFSAHDDSARPIVLIECVACKTAAQSTVSNIQYEVLLATGLISRHCDRCNETTRWKPSDQIPMSQVLVRSNPSGLHNRPDRRRTRRLKLIMQLRVRNSWGVADVARTYDVSKTGLCFVSSQRFSPGDETYITLPYGQNQGPTETKGKIVWMAEGSSGRFYGVQYVR